jgi:hypothetical protein
VGLVLLDLQFSAVFCRLLFCPFFFWPLCCLSFDLWIPITSLVSLNSSYCHSGQPLSTLIWPDSWPTDGLVNILCHLQCILTCVCVCVCASDFIFWSVWRSYDDKLHMCVEVAHLLQERRLQLLVRVWTRTQDVLLPLPENTQGTMQTVPPNQTVSNWTAVVSHSQRHIYFENEVGPAFARHSRGILSY